jgi:hypothetical protein
LRAIALRAGGGRRARTDRITRFAVFENAAKPCAELFLRALGAA